MSHIGASGRRRAKVMAAVLLALCVAAPELGGVAAAATPSPGSSVAEPGNVVLVARRREASHRERASVRRYLRKHPKLLQRKIAKYPGIVTRRMRKTAQGKPGARAVRKAAKHKKKRARAGAKARRRYGAKRQVHKKRRRRAAVGGAAVAAAHKKKAKAGNGKKAKNKDKSLSLTDWLAIGLLVLAPFAAVALLLYITDLRRRPRAPSRSKRRRSLVITPNKG